ncbi:MAG: amidophosphoribosyltransferase, partial [Mycobacteriaceae bacterium]
RWPCFYGIDFASPGELIANGLDTEDGVFEGVRQAIDADSLGYVSLDNMIAATEQPQSRLCSACFDGEYPIELPEGALAKNLLEGMMENSADSIAREATPVR